MTDLIIKYVFQNEKDTTPNHILINSKKHKLVTVRDIISLMLTHELIDAHCYLRFKDYMDDQLCWVDIRNDMAPFPINKNAEVEIKILRVPYKLYDESYIKTYNENGKESKKKDKKEKSKSLHEKNSGLKRSHTANEEPKRHETLEKSAQDRIGLDSAMFNDDGYEKINDEPKEDKVTFENSDFDFFNDKSVKVKVERARFDSFDILNEDHKPETKVTENELYNLEFSNTNYQSVKHNTREEQMQLQIDKMRSANTLEPIIKQWAYNNTVRKDIRTLLSTLDQVLWKNFEKWTRVTLSDILSDSALRNKIREAKIKFHPDKNPELSPDRLYILERVISEINAAYKDYQKLN